ncbi:aminoglycoside phosphotransferase family protein [Paucibacter sp. KCTC 42545]|uniref:aminoglycoside phosphotransferase family protein n=1 Tax=Paucibacter sp. KCTC 42545 TaxID=1768242 RepID=UPI000733A964|nr:phosphotransferase [Paucibacter sp. KCTC 42545]ALT78589.1 aminoglycoside phosphotransferase [Paucibacter sp. KCTC 42545]
MTPIAWPSPQRQQDFQAWLLALPAHFELLPNTVQEANADASSRRYLRVQASHGASYIVMDAPPESNDSRPFVAVAAQMKACGLHVPEIFAVDDAKGFLLLSDLGTLPYLQALLATQAEGNHAEANRLMRDATQALLAWQQKGVAESLPPYDEAFVRRELHIFKEWCVEREFGRQWSETQLKWWAHSCQVLVDNIAGQALVPMHRDFMVRNLMVCPPDSGNPGVLDFQDAVLGPISYDMASLLRDAFISWDEEQELDWAIRYWEQARKAGLPVNEDFGAFWQQLEWTGLQRHLKILGIFCRLKHRDHRPAYVADLPRLFAYAIKVSTRYVQLSPLTHLLQDLQGTLVETGFTLR